MLTLHASALMRTRQKCWRSIPGACAGKCCCRGRTLQGATPTVTRTRHGRHAMQVAEACLCVSRSVKLVICNLGNMQQVWQVQYVWQVSNRVCSNSACME